MVNEMAKLINEGLSRRTKAWRSMSPEERRRLAVEKAKSSLETVIAEYVLIEHRATREYKTVSTGSVYYTEYYLDYDAFLKSLVKLIYNLGDESSWKPEGDLIYKVDEDMKQASIRDSITRASLVNMSNLNPYMTKLMKSQDINSVRFFGRMCEAFLNKKLSSEIVNRIKDSLWKIAEVDKLFESNLGLNKRVKKNFDKKSTEDQAEDLAKLDMDTFLDTAKELFSEVKVIKTIEPGKTYKLKDENIFFLFMYPIEEIGLNIRDCWNGKKINTLRIRALENMEKFQLYFSYYHYNSDSSLYSETLLYGHDYDTDILDISRYKDSYFDMTYSNLVNARDWFVKFVSEHLNINESNLGLNKRVQKKYKDNDTISTSEEIAKLDDDQFIEEAKRIFKDNPYIESTKESSLVSAIYKYLYLRPKDEYTYKGALKASERIGTPIIRVDVASEKFQLYFDYYLHFEMFRAFFDLEFVDLDYPIRDGSTGPLFDLTIGNLIKAREWFNDFMSKLFIKKVDESNLGLNKRIQKKHNEKSVEDIASNIGRYVDLGLPSGTLWSVCNYGAKTLSEIGSYLNYDETEMIQKEDYEDVANGDDYEELAKHCNHSWTVKDGVHGLEFTSKSNGRSVFFPAAGIWKGPINGLLWVDECGCYWHGNSLDSRKRTYSNEYGGSFHFSDDELFPRYAYGTTCKMSVRLVMHKANESNLGLNKRVQKNYSQKTSEEVSEELGQIKFEDPEVEHICHEHGVYTIADASRVTSIREWFTGNEKIFSFNEFKYFTGLESVSFNAFGDCVKLSEIELPLQIEKIEQSAFRNTNLSHIVIPDKVKCINADCFEATILEEVYVPDSVTSIGHSCFAFCPNLKRVSLPGKIEAFGDSDYDVFLSSPAIEEISIRKMKVGPSYRGNRDKNNFNWYVRSIYKSFSIEKKKTVKITYNGVVLPINSYTGTVDEIGFEMLMKRCGHS